MTGTAQGMMDQAVAMIGLAEYPDGSNHNYVTVWYGLDGEPWCDQAVTYWAYHSGNAQAVCFGGKFAYTVAHAQAFQSHGEWHYDVAGIQPGDVVFFDWGESNSIGAIDHVGLVESVDADGTVHTIEGNIDNVCKRMQRQANVIVGYGRPAYASPAPPVPPPPVVVPPPVVKPVCHLSKVDEAAKSSSGLVSACMADVTLVQNALAKLGYVDFEGRGTFGPLTKAGYSKWQQHLGYRGSDADGIPGQTSLTKLGQASGLFTEAS